MSANSHDPSGGPSDAAGEAARIARLPLSEVKRQLAELGLDGAPPSRLLALIATARPPVEAIPASELTPDEWSDILQCRDAPLDQIRKDLDRMGVDHRSGLASLRATIAAHRRRAVAARLRGWLEALLNPRRFGWQGPALAAMTAVVLFIVSIRIEPLLQAPGDDEAPTVHATDAAPAVPEPHRPRTPTFRGVSNNIRRDLPLPDAPAASSAREEAQHQTARQPERLEPEWLKDEFLRQANGYLERGDFAAGRERLEHLAAQGDPRGMLRLGETYDPNVLKSLPAPRPAADAERARQWYLKAVQLGSVEARRRLDALDAGVRIGPPPQ